MFALTSYGKKQLSKLKAESFIPKPRDFQIDILKTCRDEHMMQGPFLKTHKYFAFAEGNFCNSIDKVSKNMMELGFLVHPVFAYLRVEKSGR